MTETRRYAIYFAPPEGSDLEAFGRHFLGRDHVTGEDVDQPVIDGLSADDLKDLTRSARHYGFHATLKAPFSLHDGYRVEDLCEAAASFVAKRTAFEAPPLDVSALSRWVAFTLSSPSPEMDALAADCVRHFEPFRAPLSESDIERRRKSGLTARQDEQMLAFGYPYIFDDFEFHMTLAGPLDEDQRDRLLDGLKVQADALTSIPLRVDAVALYEQPDRESAFIQTARFPFGAR